MDSNDLVFEFAAGTVLSISQNGKPFVACNVELMFPCVMSVQGVRQKQELAELLLGNDRVTYRLNHANLNNGS